MEELSSQFDTNHIRRDKLKIRRGHRTKPVSRSVYRLNIVPNRIDSQYHHRCCSPFEICNSNQCNRPVPKSYRRRWPSIWRPFVIVTVMLLAFTTTMVQSSVVECPHVNLIHRLTAPNGAPVNRYSSLMNTAPHCDCSTIEEGWEITCYANDDPMIDADSVMVRSGPADTIGRFDSDSSDSSGSGLDYELDYNILHVLFIVRYEIGRQLILTCDKGTPAFKPALFQGFGIDSIDSFTISKCELPLTLPLSVILYRTQTHGLVLTSAVGTSSYSINTTGHADIVSPIRSLYLKSPKRVNVKQLNTLLSDLESLEQLTLSDFDLNDIDNYAVEKSSKHGATVNGFRIHPTTTNRRAKRHDNGTVAADTNTEDYGYDTTTTTTTTMDNDDLTLPTTTMPPPVAEDHRQSRATNTTTPPLVLINNDEDVTMMNDTTSSISDGAAQEETTTASSIMTTALIDSVPVTAEDFINITSRRNESETPPPPTLTTSSPTGAMNMEENSINDVNLEYGIDADGKPILVLDENVLNFARILPNLRMLRLIDFIKESTIPNVLFQIMEGLKKLEYLELSSNKLETIPSHAFVFTGSSLKKLYLYRNSIKEIDVNAFANMSRLEILDISHNELSRLDNNTFAPLENLQYLSLKSNLFENFSEDLFRHNDKLLSLDLGQNDRLTPLPANIFRGLTSLSNISLAYCNLTEISPDTRQLFRNVPGLNKIDVRGNMISNLTTPGLFAWNKALSKLDFSSNQIDAISGEIFGMNSSKVVEINLNRNRLHELPEDLFQNARNIRFLYVQQNKIRETSPMTFTQLRMLEELDLSHNQITTIGTPFNQLPFGVGGSLRKVNLSHNNLTNFDAEIIDINWVLYVSFNELDLSHNNFSGTLTVPIFMSSNSPTVMLDVSFNGFNTVDVENILAYMTFKDESQTPTAQSWETLVRLDNNPFHCDCFLFPFLNYSKSVGRIFSKNYHNTIIRKTLFIFDSSTKLACDQPALLKDRPLINLKLDELICPIDDRRICPDRCQCTYRSSDQSAIIDCDGRDLVSIPEEMKLSRHYNLSLKDSSAKVPKVDSVVFQLRENHLQSIESLAPMILWSTDHKFRPTFVEIHLDRNNISVIEPDAIPDNYESAVLIKNLSLRNNLISKIPMRFLQNFELLANPTTPIDSANETKREIVYDRNGKPFKTKIFMGDNPIDCYNDPAPPGSECHLRDFKLWLSSHPNLVGDVNMIKCDENSIDLQRVRDANSSLVIVNMSDDLLCPMLIPPPSSTALMAISIVCVVLASSLFVVSVLYYRNKQTILAFIYIHLNPIFICLSFTEDDLDEEKIYDAFVSYSSSDRDIVMELIEKLEKPHDMNEVSLILQNGISIHEGKADQVVPENAFKKSSTLKSNKDLENGPDINDENHYRLCIHERDWLPGNLISWNIVNSVQNSKRTILILSQNFIRSIWFQVEFHTAYYQMLEDQMDRLIVIVRGELPPKDQLDKDLNFLLTTKTYLVWGEKWFWEKLYYAMPHKKQRQLKAEKSSLNGKIKNQPKYNGSMGNGRLNGINHHQKDGMLKWSHNGSKPNQKKAEAMKEYVDQTIASHFQLNSYSPSNSNGIGSNSPESNPKPNGGDTSSGTTTTTTGTATPPSTKPAPKSLRNSGTLSTATPNTLKAFGGFDNKCFINETNT